jgi:hypothetical protein
LKRVIYVFVALMAAGIMFGCELFTTYAVTYNANGATGGSVPTDPNKYHQGTTVTVLGNTGGLANTGNAFAGWNTKADGKGTLYAAGATFAAGMGDMTLYAMWNSQTASLSNTELRDSEGTLYPFAPPFDPAMYSYTALIGSGDTYTLTLTPSDSNAAVISVTEIDWVNRTEYNDSGTGSAWALTLPSYDTFVTIVVRAQDGTVSHYWIEITRPS